MDQKMPRRSWPGHKKRHARLEWIWVMAALISLSLAGGLEAETRVLDRIVVKESAEKTSIVVKFNRPVGYVSHAPAKRGDLLRIELRPTSLSEADQGGFGEALAWRPSRAAPLTKVAYDPTNPESAVLTLAFTHAVDYQVKPGSDFRSIVITLPAAIIDKPVKAERDPGSGSDGMPGVVAAPMMVPEQPETLAVPRPAPPPAKKDTARGPVVDLSYPYAINLESSVTAIEESAIPDLEPFRTHRLYVAEFTKDGRVWNRLRLGFFPTKKAAAAVRDSIERDYPGAWITRVSPRERASSASAALGAPGRDIASTPSAAAPRAKGAKPLPPGKLKSIEDVMAAARVAMTAGDLARAIQLYTKALRSPDHPLRPEAQELLGLARERNGQLAHAKAEYETYLQDYPQGEGAARVRQRLAGLLTARAKPRDRLRKADGGADGEEGLDWGLSGSWSQFFNHDESITDVTGRETTRNELDSDLDLVASVRGSRLESGVRFAGSHARDFDTDEKNSRVRTLYAEARDSEWEVFTRLGRQNRSTGGVLGRFDGGLVSYQVTPRVKANVVGGFPVASTEDLDPDYDRRFAGLSFDLGTFDDRWDTNVFFINQTADGFDDRRALGGEVRYFDANKSAFSLIDYDVLFRQLNIALLNGTYIFEDRTTINMALDYRKSPLLTTTNALQGQGVVSLAGLDGIFTESELRDLAEDRTAESKSVTIGASHPLNTIYQISGDFMVTDFSSTQTSGGILGTEGTGLEYFYSTQLIGSGVLKDGDLAVLGLRYADLDTSSRYTIDLNTRYPVDRKFRVNPRLRTDYRDNKDNDGSRISVRPSVRLDYNWNRELSLELDLGGEWSRDKSNGVSEDTVDLFAIVGYRVDF